MVKIQQKYQEFNLDWARMSNAPATPTIIWFRDDLRIEDNAALRWASEQGPVIGLVIDEDPAVTGARPLGAAARWWWLRSVDKLAFSLGEHGVPLLRCTGDPLRIVAEVAERFSAKAVTWNRRYHRPLTELDAELKATLRARGLDVRSHAGFLLCEPWEVSTAAGTPYKVFTPFSRSAFPIAEKAAATLGERLPASLMGPGQDIFEPTPGATEVPEPAWAEKLAEHCAPGEAAAHKRFGDFLDRLREKGNYAAGRDQIAQDVTSGLSPHLRFGEISVHRIWAEISAAADAGDIDSDDASSFLNELLWRDFAWHRLHELPDMQTENVRKNFDRFGWAWDAKEMTRLRADARDPRLATADDTFHAAFAAWRSGTTGIPLIDAGMRELWTSGTMHNRVRMVVASFLTKNLQIHWRHGEQWFWETLVDADPASNSFNWQWAAGSGDDASPYFRIFNPETQARKFDPESAYIRRWIPEFGTPDYPAPIVDLKQSRQDALDAYAAIK